MVCPSNRTTYFCLQWECSFSPLLPLPVPCPGRRLASTWNSKFVWKEVCVLSTLSKIWEDSWIFYSVLTYKESYENIIHSLTFNFSPVDGNFCYRYSQALSYIKQFHIKRPEEEQEIANTVTLISRKEMVALLIKSLAWFKEVGVQLWSWYQWYLHLIQVRCTWKGNEFLW